MKVIPGWDKMTQSVTLNHSTFDFIVVGCKFTFLCREQKDRVMGEVETLQVVEIRRHRNIPKIRDHFIVKGDVEEHLCSKKYVHTPYVPQAQRPKPDAAVSMHAMPSCSSYHTEIHRD